MPGDATNLTLVCCVESGRLEHQTLLMAGSLRKFGGRLANLPMIAVVGRFGPPLRPSTRAQFENLGVQLVHAENNANRFPWFNYANKPVAVMHAQRIATTETIAWIDSDILFAQEPQGLLLSPEEQFAARYDPLLDSVEVGNPKNLSYWKKLCDVTESSFNDLIWLQETHRPDRILFFNSGVFVWRTNTEFAQTYVGAFEALLTSGIAQSNGSFFSADQIILNNVITKCGLRWRHMAHSDHHMIFPGLLSGPAAAPPVTGSAILHYSGSLADPHRTTFLRRLQSENLRLFDWLLEEENQIAAAAGGDRVPLTTQILARWLKAVRGARWRLYARRAKRFHDDGAIVPELPRTRLTVDVPAAGSR
jgi:hypothetical protein